MKSRKNTVHESDEFFRQSQISWAALEIAKKQPPLMSQVGVFFLLLFVLVVGVYSYRTEVPVIVEGIGKITSEVPPVPIRAVTTFTADKIFVKDNQDVKKGQVLITSVENLKEEDFKKLKNFLMTVKKINSREPGKLCLSCMPDIDAAMQIYLSIRAQGEVLNIISPINDHLRGLKTQIEVYKDIEKSLTAVRLQVKNAQKKINEIKRRQADKMLAKEIEELESIVVGGNTQINEKYRTAGQQIKDLRSTLVARAKELDDRLVQFGRIYTVTAPFDGKVSTFKVKGSGEVVSGGQVLMEIVPANVPFIAEIEVQNKDISQVRQGDEVIVSIDSLPELDYGTIKGQIKEIVRAEPSQDPQAGAMGDRAYRVKVSLQQQKLSRGNEDVSLLLGMSLRGRVVVKYETLLRSMYRNLFKVKENIQVTK